MVKPSTRDTPSRRKAKPAQCKMKTYGGFIIMAGLPPRGIKPKCCPLPAMPNGFCEKHDPEGW